MKITKLTIVTIFCILFLQACSIPFFTEDERPNFLIILTDDQRYDSMQYMPKTQSLIFDQGVNFPHAYITTPLCCPSRSSILTGMYAHNHGVRENEIPLEKKTFFDFLHEDGYYTGLVGKYLNSWKGETRPEFDYWVSFKYGETRYTNPLLNVNGEWSRHQGEYITYLLGDYAIDFLDKAAGKRKPFVLLLSVNAPHQPNTPAIEDNNLQIALPDWPPSFNEEDVSDKPAWMQFKDEPLNESLIQSIEKYRRDQILTLVSLDRTLEKVMTALESTGELDNTVVIFLSDNGVHWGEHRLYSKNTFYEESVRVPFAIRYPPLITEPYTENKVIANIDIAPTLLELAGIPIPEDIDGLSLVGLLNGQAEWREGVLLEGWPPRAYYSAIHTDRYVLAETPWDDFLPDPDTPQYELYDLEIDPYQLDNLAGNPEYDKVIEHLMSLLEQEKARGIPTQ